MSDLSGERAREMVDAVYRADSRRVLGGEQGRSVYDRSDSYRRTYRPSPHIA